MDADSACSAFADAAISIPWYTGLNAVWLPVLHSIIASIVLVVLATEKSETTLLDVFDYGQLILFIVAMLSGASEGGGEWWSKHQDTRRSALRGQQVNTKLKVICKAAADNATTNAAKILALFERIKKLGLQLGA